MARAHIEWDTGNDWTIEQYEEYQKYTELAGDKDWHWTEYMENLREFNQKFGFPGKAGEML